ASASNSAAAAAPLASASASESAFTPASSTSASASTSTSSSCPRPTSCRTPTFDESSIADTDSEGESGDEEDECGDEQNDVHAEEEADLDVGLQSDDCLSDSADCAILKFPRVTRGRSLAIHSGLLRNVGMNGREQQLVRLRKSRRRRSSEIKEREDW